MADQNEEMKARLMAEAEEAINRLLEEASEKGRLTMTEIEHLARQTGQRVMEEITQTLVDEEGRQEADHLCPQCGERMRYKGRKSRTVISETGEVQVERAYYYCESCRTGLFPPGSADGSG